MSELRLTLIEERLDIELQLGRHQGTVAELEELVATHPLRERLRGLLMLALYRAGRQADALRVFQEGRHVLGEELGLEPGHELRRLEAAILAQDRSLDGPGDRRSRGTTTRRAALDHSRGADATGRPRRGAARPHAPVGRRNDSSRSWGREGWERRASPLEVARLRSADLEFGGCLVELAPVGDPAGVRAAIAVALDVPDPSRLAEAIGDREMLIVLDNCEHVISTAAEVAEDLLRHCPALRLLATSREGLRVGGETIWPVPPLAADDAVRLFVARANAAGAPLELSDDHARLITDICTPPRRAATRHRARGRPHPSVPAPTDRVRLNDRFRLLTGGSRTALPRQQTLRAVVDWSYELLFDDEQRVFERLVGVPRWLRSGHGGGRLRRRGHRQPPTSPIISTHSSTSHS